jgi:hypothetical protein
MPEVFDEILSRFSSPLLNEMSPGLKYGEALLACSSVASTPNLKIPEHNFAKQ